MTEVRRTTLGHMGFGSLELAGLIDGGINPGIGDQFIQGLETLDVSDLGQDGRAGNGANARDGSDVLRDLLHEISDGLVDLGALGIQQFQLSQQAAHLKMNGIGQETNAHRLAGLGLELFSLFQSKAAVAGLSQDLSQFLEVKIGEFLGGNGFLQHSPGGLQKNTGKLALIFGKNPIQDGQELTFEVADLLCEPKRKRLNSRNCKKTGKLCSEGGKLAMRM